MLMEEKKSLVFIWGRKTDKQNIKENTIFILKEIIFFGLTIKYLQDCMDTLFNTHKVKTNQRHNKNAHYWVLFLEIKMQHPDPLKVYLKG